MGCHVKWCLLQSNVRRYSASLLLNSDTKCKMILENVGVNVHGTCQEIYLIATSIFFNQSKLLCKLQLAFSAFCTYSNNDDAHLLCVSIRNQI